MNLKRSLAAGATVVIAAFSLTACGGGASGAPEDASKDDFCNAYTDSSAMESGTTDPKDMLKAMQDGADKLEEVGTPEGIPDDAREGFETYVDEIKDLDEDDLDNPEDSNKVSDDDADKVMAFTKYAGETCGDAMSEMPTDEQS